MTPATRAAMSALDAQREASKLQERQWRAVELRCKATLAYAAAEGPREQSVALARISRCTTLYLELEQRVRALIGGMS